MNVFSFKMTTITVPSIHVCGIRGMFISVTIIAGIILYKEYFCHSPTNRGNEEVSRVDTIESDLVQDAFENSPIKPKRFGTSKYPIDYGDMVEFDYETCLSKKTSANKWMLLSSTESLARFNCTRLITLGEIGGRMGNRMFQVASLIGIATWHGFTPVLNENLRLFKNFELLNRIKFKPENISMAHEQFSGMFDERFHQLDTSKNWSISRYLQSWKYFDGAEQRVRKAFTLKNDYKLAAEEYIESKRRGNGVIVGVHVRRGDFLKNKTRGYAVAPVGYIQRAMNYFRDRFQRVRFVFVSTDIAWYKANFNQSDNYFTPFKEPAQDMALLASCDHVIATSGTFSWWGAWLAGGTVVYYRGHPTPGSKLAKKLNVDDFYPKHWIGMY